MRRIAEQTDTSNRTYEQVSKRDLGVGAKGELPLNTIDPIFDAPELATGRIDQKVRRRLILDIRAVPPEVADQRYASEVSLDVPRPQKAENSAFFI